MGEDSVLELCFPENQGILSNFLCLVFYILININQFIVSHANRCVFFIPIWLLLGSSKPRC